MQLNLSPSSDKSMIIIIGNTGTNIFVFIQLITYHLQFAFIWVLVYFTDFELTWKFKDLMSVRPVKVVEFGITGQAEYQVKATTRKINCISFTNSADFCRLISLGSTA